MMNTLYRNPAFLASEHQDRADRASKLLEAEGLAACVCTSPELIYYITGYDAHTHHAIGSQALILCADGRPPRLLIRDGDVPQAKETLCIGELRSFRLGSSPLSTLLRNNLGEMNALDQPVGLDASNYTTNGGLTLDLRAALGSDKVRDVSRLMGRMRVVLSATEIAYVRRAAEHAKKGLSAFYASARTGMSEIELAAEIEYAMRRAGSDYPAVPTWLASGNRSHCQHGMANDRVLQAGDLVHAEFSGVSRRYQCVTMGSLVLGEPSRRMAELAEGARASYAAGLTAAKLGAPVGLMERAYADELEARGLGNTFIMRFGVGTSAAFPPVWENQISIQLESKEPLEEGMVFYIHASMQDMEAQIGMLFGDSFLMTANGPIPLTDAPIDLEVVAV